MNFLNPRPGARNLQERIYVIERDRLQRSLEDATKGDVELFCYAAQEAAMRAIREYVLATVSQLRAHARTRSLAHSDLFTPLRAAKQTRTRM